MKTRNFEGDPIRKLQLNVDSLHRRFQTVLLLGLIAASSSAMVPGAMGQKATAERIDISQALQLYRSGQYADVVRLADLAEQDDFLFDESWAVLRMRGYLEVGKYEEAARSLEKALEKFPNSIRIRWIGAHASRKMNDIKGEFRLLDEIEKLWNARPFRFRDVENQIVLGRYYQSRQRDAREIMTEFFDKAKTRNSLFAETFVAIGELALSKHDYQLAAENFSKALKLDGSNPDSFYGLASAFQPSDPDKASAYLQQALELNPRHVPSLLLQVDGLINGEEYEQAAAKIESVLAINPHQSDAWAYRAVIAHLKNDFAREGECRSRALAHWESNPGVDHLIGKKLSQKYRFEEGATYQRRSLVYAPSFLPAKIQLAHDLLRLGQELEGWKLAEEVFDADQYSVVASNLVGLRDHLSKFTTIESKGFVIRMDKAEAEIYGAEVVRLLREAELKLVDKYQVELQTPIFIEIFPEQQDFAIRTFGLPGGEGFLGVCFGRVVTMNSPAAQGTSLTNWKSVLWHEFCHVVTLQKTRNRMPRWLSEGISVYEERLANPAWGQSINPRYREMVLGEDLTPVSKLSSAFLAPKSAAHLDFAYFESSLVVQYIVEKHGIAALQKVLRDLGIGIPIGDALRRYVEPEQVLDVQFKEYATNLARELAPDADWTDPQIAADASSERWQQWNDAHPRNVRGIVGQARALVREQKYEDAIQLAESAIAIYSDRDGIQPAYQLLAGIYRQQNQPAQELAVLRTLSDLDASSVEVNARLLELASAAGEWNDVERYATRLLGINPMIPIPHRYLAMAAEKLNKDSLLVPALTALTRMSPVDPADVHYRLAAAQYRSGELTEARRNVLLSLDVAPRFRAAHQLLLQIQRDRQAAAGPAPGSTKNKE